MTDLLASLLDAAGDEPALALGLLLALGAGAAVLGLLGLARERRALRRRAGEGGTAGRGTAPNPAGPAERRRSLDRAIAYLEANVAKAETKEARLLRLRLIQAGFFDPRAVPVFLGARLAGAALFGGGALLALPLLVDDVEFARLWMWAAGFGAVGYFLPTLLLRRRIARRVAQHRAGFPDFMDLMVVCAEAGLSMEASIERIARELVEGYPSLAENLAMVSLELRAGKAFPEALERLGTRLGIEEAAMLATLLQQSSELGTSLSGSLRIYSDEMRNKRMSRAEEKAYALPAKLVVPLMLFVFPVLLVTLALPIIVRLAGGLGS